MLWWHRYSGCKREPAWFTSLVSLASIYFMITFLFVGPNDNPIKPWLTDWCSDSLIDTPRIRSSVTATSETAAFHYSCSVDWSQAVLLNNNLVSKAKTLANLLFIFKEVTINSCVPFWLQTSDITSWRNTTLFFPAAYGCWKSDFLLSLSALIAITPNASNLESGIALRQGYVIEGRHSHDYILRMVEGDCHYGKQSLGL